MCCFYMATCKYACGVLKIYQSVMLEILYIEEETEINKIELIIKMNITL